MGKKQPQPPKAKDERIADIKRFDKNSKRLRQRAKGKIKIAPKPEVKEQWYRVKSFFDDDAKAIMEIGGENVVLSGWVPPDNDVAVVLVPPCVTQDQGLALQKIIEANLRKPVLVLTNNTQLVRLTPISDEAADLAMAGSDDQSEIIQVSKEGRCGEEQPS